MRLLGKDQPGNNSINSQGIAQDECIVESSCASSDAPPPPIYGNGKGKGKGKEKMSLRVYGFLFFPFNFKIN